jgi:DNA-directed RNA polymerase subunit RPC12/RpoP
MKLISTSWSCQRCGAAFISTPRGHGLCGQCVGELEALARLAPIANQPCPLCGGPVCADCGKALITLVPAPPVPPGLAKRSTEVSGDDG